MATNAPREFDPHAACRHTVFVQHAVTKRRETLTGFQNIEAWVSALTASASFQPCPSPTTFRWSEGEQNGPYLDGDFPGCKDGPLTDCMSFPLPGSRSVLRYAPIRFFYMVIGIFTDQRWMYEQGYDDAVELLIPHFPAGRPAGQTHSLSHDDAVAKLKLHFDVENLVFAD